MRGCNRVPGGQAKHNSFNLFCKLKLFHLHNVCTFPLSLLLLQFLVSFPSVSFCIFPLSAPLSLFDSVFLSEINFTKYIFFLCQKKRTGFTEPSRELLSQFQPPALYDPLSAENQTPIGRYVCFLHALSFCNVLSGSLSYFLFVLLTQIVRVFVS